MPNIKDDVKQIVVYTPKRLHRHLKQKALDEDTSMNKLILAAVEEKYPLEPEEDHEPPTPGP